VTERDVGLITDVRG